MHDEKLKIMLALLSGIVFSLIFILLAFVLPIENKTQNAKPLAGKPLKNIKENPKSYLEKVSREFQK
jgi:hypothetical protein